MIIKSFELNKKKIHNFSLCLLHGNNQGIKEQIIKEYFLKDFKGDILKYDEIDLLNDKDEFISKLLNKSLFEDNRIIIISRITEKILSIIEEILEKNISETKIIILAQNLEKRSKLRNFFEKENIQISGEVNIPGVYPLISDNEDLASILNRVGGLTSKALINGISIYRDKKYFQNMMDNNEEISNKNKNSKVRVAWKNSSIILMPGDSIVVRESTKTVNIIGAVQNPGLVEYNEGKPLRYYINSVGGITEKGNKRSIILVEPNGLVRPKKWYSSPSVTDGSTIYVSEKENTEPFDATQFATNWTQIISSVITAVILSQQIGSS